VAAISARRRWLDQRTCATLAVLALLGVVTALLITHSSWWLSFPSVLQSIQFPFRLVTYLALITVLGVIALLAIPAVQRSRLAILALLLATGWQVGLAVDLALTARAQGGELLRPHPTATNVSAASPPTSFPGGQFRLVAEHPLGPAGPLASVGPVGDDTPREIVLSGSQLGGSLVGTNVVASPLIHVTGQARIVGTSPEGFEVLRVSTGRATTRWHARVAPACNSCLSALTGKAPVALLLGKLASLAGVLALFGLSVAGIRARRGPGSAGRGSTGTVTADPSGGARENTGRGSNTRAARAGP